MLKGVHTLICEVQDMNRALAFYRDVLGLEVESSSPHWSSIRIGDSRLGLHPPFHASRGANVGGWIIGVEVADIRALKERLAEFGLGTGGYHDTPSGVVMDFADHDGNRLQAIQVGVKAQDL